MTDVKSKYTDQSALKHLLVTKAIFFLITSYVSHNEIQAFAEFYSVKQSIFYFQGNIEYYSDEVEINAKFRTFTKNCSLVFAGHNTVSVQLRVSSKRGLWFLL